jgi:sugar porter (SP) family MFS transporter
LNHPYIPLVSYGRWLSSHCQVFGPSGLSSGVFLFRVDITITDFSFATDNHSDDHAEMATTVSMSTSQVEAPITAKTYFICAFTAFGGILFGYDSGYISGVLGMDYFKYQFGKPVPAGFDDTSFYYNGTYYMYETYQKSLITSILSAGTFFGAIAAGPIADWIGRRITVILGCLIFIIGVVLQVASTTVDLLVAGRLVAGLGVGFVTAIIILYMSEIAPKAVRGSVVAGYTVSCTCGLLLASCVNYATKNRFDTGSYRIPIALQFLWGLILGGGLCFLPESPRWYVSKGKLDQAAASLCRLRSQPKESEFVQNELNELIANFEYEMSHMQNTWADCFSGGWKQNSNLRRMFVGITMQMMQQWSMFFITAVYHSRFAFTNLCLSRYQLYLLLWHNVFSAGTCSPKCVLHKHHHYCGRCCR